MESLSVRHKAQTWVFTGLTEITAAWHTALQRGVAPATLALWRPPRIGVTDLSRQGRVGNRAVNRGG